MFPSRREFTDEGFGPVRWAVYHHGGVDRWAAQFGLPRVNRYEGRRRYWTDERIERELQAMAGELGHWPTAREFRSAGRTGLKGAVRRTGGRPAWQARLGLQAPTRGDDLRRVNRVLQDELRRRGLAEVHVVDAARWLHDAGVLADSDARPGLRLRTLAQADAIEGAGQRPPRRYGRWFIRRTAG